MRPFVVFTVDSTVTVGTILQLTLKQLSPRRARFRFSYLSDALPVVVLQPVGVVVPGETDFWCPAQGMMEVGDSIELRLGGINVEMMATTLSYYGPDDSIPIELADRH